MTGGPGFHCPFCGSRTDVKDSRPREEGGIRRRRACQGCRARFTTWEIRAGDLDGLMSGVEDLPPSVLQQVKEGIGLLSRLSNEDRLLILSMARRCSGGSASKHVLWPRMSGKEGAHA